MLGLKQLLIMLMYREAKDSGLSTLDAKKAVQSRLNIKNMEQINITLHRLVKKGYFEIKGVSDIEYIDNNENCKRILQHRELIDAAHEILMFV